MSRLSHAADEVRSAAGALLWTWETAETEEFYIAGGALTALTGALAEISEHLAKATHRYGDERVLRDDQDADPAERLATARGHLHDAQAHYDAAGRSIADYHSAIGHIAVEADINATPDGDTR